MFGEGLPLYHANYTISELNHSPLGDGSFIIYVNERGELPPDLKRGVLSQDALYDLLERVGK